MNKVGPYNNPQETYNYYYLPFCAPELDKKPQHKWGGLGEVLGGNQLIDSQLDIKFRSKPPKAVTAALACIAPSSMSDRFKIVADNREQGMARRHLTPRGAAADVPKRTICTTLLDDKSAQVFRNAVKKYYW